MPWTLITTALGVTNATEAQPNDLPEVVLYLTEGGARTGTRIHPRWVLAAASAFDDIDLASFPSGFATVVPGTSFTADTERIEVTEVHVHPDYLALGPSYNAAGTSEDGVPRHALALLRLAEPMAGAVPLNRAPLDGMAGWPFTVAGFGITAFEGTGSGTQRFGTTTFGEQRGDVLFTEVPGGSSPCQSDTGGPALVPDGRGGRVGVALLVHPGDCGTSVPATYLQLAPDLAWIEATLGEDTIETVAWAPPAVACVEDGDGARCTVENVTADGAPAVRWSWGDGAEEAVSVDVDADLERSHTWAAAGTYEVTACVTVQSGVVAHEPCVTTTVQAGASEGEGCGCASGPGTGTPLLLGGLLGLRRRRA